MEDEFDKWFGLGYSWFSAVGQVGNNYPPLFQPEKQRAWIEGMLMARGEWLDRFLDSSDEAEESPSDYLNCHVSDPELLAQLLGGLSNGARS